MLPVAVPRLWLRLHGVGEAPSLCMLPVTHRERKGQGSDLLSHASNKQARGSVSHASMGLGEVGALLCLVIVSLSPTTFRRRRRADKQKAPPHKARALSLRVIHRHHPRSIARGPTRQNRGTPAEAAQVRADCFSGVTQAQGFRGTALGVRGNLWFLPTA